MGSADNVLGQNSKDIFAKPLLQDASLLGGTASLGIQSTSPLGTEALAPSLPILNPPTTAPLALSSSSVPNLFPSTAASQTTAATLPLTSAAGIDPLTGIKSEAGVFTVNPTGYISADFLFDGGSHQGQVALFSLSGMEHLRPGSLDFIQEASRRALSNSAQGYVLISDAEEDAKFSDQLLGDPKNNNQGNYQGTKTFAMRPGDRVAMMVMPNGRISELLKNPNLGGNRQPVFSMPTAQSHSTWRPFADLTGDGTTFAIKDTPSSTNHDYNDFIFQLKGLGGGQIPTIDRLINRGYDWRASALGQQIITYARSQSTLPILPNGNGELVFNEADSSVPASNSSTTTFRTTSATVESTSATATTSTSDLYQTNVNILWRNTITGETDIWSLADPTSSTLTTPKVVDKGLHTAVTPLLADPDWQIHAAGDANRDQQSDLIWRNRRTGENALWTMNGNTRLSSAYLMQISDQDWQIQGAGDFDRDHNIDLVWRNTRTGENAIWYMDAAGTTIARSAYLLPISDQNWQIVGVGDFDSDLIPDLVWRNRQTGENSIWYMSGNTGSQRRAGLYFTQISDQNWKIEGAGDFNQDGRADLLWHNTQTGATATWLQTLPGTTQATSSSIDFRVGWLDSLPAGQSWKAVTPYVVREKRPVIEMRLQRDTDIAGDNITTDPTISGKVTADREISELKGRLLVNGTAGVIVDLKSSLERDNSFTLTRRQLEQLNQGNPLAGGTYTLELQSADKRYNRAVPTQLTFTLQPTHPPVFTSTPVLDARVVRSAGGRVIVANDEWALSDRAFSENPQPNGHINPTVKVAADTRQFTKNIANYFTGGRPGSFLVYSDHPSITGTALTQAFHDAGHQITVSTTVSFTPELLQQYDGVFVGGFASSDPAINRARNQVLSNYVQQGGNVYLFAGTAAVGATEPMTPVQDIRFLDTHTREARTEAKVWELFLQTLGLKFDELYNSTIDSVAVNPSSHPLFRNVNQLLQSYGNSIIDLNVTDNQGTIVSTNRYGQGMFAVYDAALTNPLAYRYAVTANDPDQDSLTYSLVSAPDGMSIDTNGIIRWAPREAQAGRHPVVVRVDDGHGGSTEQSFTVRVRRDPRTVPTPTNLQLAVASDSGSSNSDRVTRITTSTITGMAEAGSQVQLFQGTTLVGQSMTSETGVWQITTTALADGVNPLNAIATDSDDNVSSASETLTITIDAVEPQITLTTSLTTAPLRNDARLAGNVNGTGSAVSSLTYRWNDGPEIPITLSASDAFDQAINFVGLNNGVHTLTMTTIDVAGNVIATPFSVEVSLNFAPTDVVLSRNTISENPSSGALIGTLMTTDANLNDTHQYTLIDDAGGRFQLVGNELRVAPNTVLDYEMAASYILTVRVVDSGTPSLTFDKQFTIQVGDVNERPTFTSQPLVNAETNQLYRYTITTADAENGSRIIRAAKPLPSWLSLVDQGDGTAILRGTPDATQSGLYAIELLVMDAGGLTATQTYLLGVDVVLREGSRFHTSQSVSFTVDRPTMLSFTIDPSFDSLNNVINDAFEVALVDAKGRSLVPTIASEREAFFNWTEGEAVVFGAGTTYASTTKTITLNLTGIAKNTPATLVFRLLNDDQDSGTQVRIRDIQLLDAPIGSLPPVTGYSGATNAVAPSTPNFNVLEDISSSVTVEYDRTSYDSAKKLLYAEVAVRNSGTYSVDVPLLVAVTHLSDPSVLVRNPDGYTPEGLPYYDFSHLVADGKLDPSKVTSDPLELSRANRSLVFYNPNGVQFTYDLVVLAQLNQAPVITSKPLPEVLAGKIYTYQVKATGSNQDTLAYSLKAAPDGMAIDAQTGVITWQDTAAHPGNHSVIVQASDGRGGITTQIYTLAVLQSLPNRPPQFTSTPTVDAYVNQNYQYDADALDLDQDNPLTYSLVSGPDGMTIDPMTGNVQWKPPAALVLGDTVLSTINAAGQIDEFTFTGTPGQRLYIDPLRYSGNAHDWQLEVYSPTGRRVLNVSLSENQLLTLLENGNYRVRVSQRHGGTGNYGFSLIDVAHTDIILPETVIQGKLTPGSEDDLFRFNGRKGQRIFLDKLLSSGNLDWVLYNSNNQVITSSHNFSDIEAVLPANDEYLLALRGQSAFGAVLDYSFSLIVPDVMSQPFTVGNLVSGDISKKGEQDNYTFVGKAGQQVYLDAIKGSSSIQAYVYDPSGRQITSTNFPSDRASDAGLVLGMDGIYTVVIDGYQEATGAYQFRLLDRAQAELIQLDADIEGTFDQSGTLAKSYRFTLSERQYLFFDGLGGTGGWTLYDASGRLVNSGETSTNRESYLEPGDYWLILQGYGRGELNYRLRAVTPDFAPAEFLQFGETITGSILEKGEQDSYTFVGKAGQQLVFDSLRDNPVNVTIYDPAGRVISSASRSNDSAPLVLGVSGTYRVVVDGSDEAIGDYAFRLLDKADAVSVQLDQDIVGTFDSAGGFQESYRFALTERQYVFIDGIAGSGYWRLYDPSGKALTENSLTSDRELYLESGEYWLLAQGFGSGSLNYQVRLITPDFATPQPRVWGDVVTGSIAEQGERDTYTFEGKIGQQLFLDVTKPNANIVVEIFDPTDRSLGRFSLGADRDLSYYYSSFYSDVLTTAGTYRVVVDGEGGGTGDYGFRFLPKADATTIDIGTSISGTFDASGSLQNAYRFTLDSNRVVSIRKIAGEGIWTLYSPSGRRLTSQGLSSTSEQDLVAGEYWILFQKTGTIGDYSFQIEDLRAGTAATPTGGIVNYGQIVSGSLTTNADSNAFQFSGIAGQQLFLDAIEGNVHQSIAVYDPTGQKIYQSLTANYHDSTIRTLTLSGTYQVIVGSSTGSYSFRLLDRASATPVALDTDITGTFDSAGRLAQSYRLSLTEGQFVFFDTQSSNNGSWYLYDSNGAEIQKSSPFGANPLSSDREFFLGAGDYWLVLQGNSFQPFTYQLKLITPALATAPAFNLGDTVLGTLAEKGSYNTHSFSGTAGQQLFLDVLEGDYYSFITIYDPTGQVIYNERGSFERGPNNSPYNYGLVLKQDGTYKVVVDGDGETTGNYSFRLLNKQDATPILLDTDIQGTFDAAGRFAQSYRFNMAEGQYLFFDGQLGNGQWWLYGSNGESITGSSLSSDREFFLGAGDYWLVLQGNSFQPFTYQLKLITPALATAPAFNLGDTVLGTLAEKGSYNTHSFSGTAGQQLFLDVLEGDYYSFITIYDPTGQVIYNERGSFERGPNNSPYNYGLVLKQDGTYKVVVDGDGETTGNYSFRLLNKQDATPILLDTDIQGTFDIAQQAQTYRFTLAERQYLFLDSLQGSGNWQLYGSNGAQVKSGSLSSDSEFDLEAGDYWLVVQGSSSTNPTYQLRLITPAMIDSQVNLGQIVSGTLAEKGSRNTHNFMGAAGQQLFLDVLEGNFHSFITVFDPLGNLVFNNRNNTDYGPSENGLILKLDGIYQLVIDGEGETVGNYAIRLSEKSQATEVTLNSSTFGSFGATGQESKLYRFIATAGQSLYLDTTSSGTGSWNLYAPGGEQITGGSLGRDYEWTVSAAGEYLLAFRGNGAANSGFQFQLAPLQRQSVDLLFDAVVSGTIAAKGQQNLYTFSGKPGQQIFIDVLTAANNSLRARLYSPTQALVYDRGIYRTHLGSFLTS